MKNNLKISIFTPTHNTKYIHELYESIKNQDFYEWVIILNKGARINIDDSRVKLFTYKHTIYDEHVGALKKYACSKCTGDILLEVDHDDLLTPTAIEEVKLAFEDSSIGFVYSNTAYFRDNFEAYDKWDGWVYRDYLHDNKYVLNECVPFEVTAHSISKIWYAPDHLRAWRRSVYEEVGGHSEFMRVLDDQDLMARTYLVTKFKHIDKCLYLYRVTGENTWIKHNQEIQNNVLRIYDKYILDLAIRWSELNNLHRLDFGGSFNGHEKLACIDIRDGIDLNKTLPFEDNSVGIIRANDVLEHLDDKLHIIKEIYRILVPNGILISSTPNALSQGGYQDPTHKSLYVENSFRYYTEAPFAQYIDTPVRFQNMRLYTTELNNYGVNWVVSHLLALKGQNACGPINI